MFIELTWPKNAKTTQSQKAHAVSRGAELDLATGEVQRIQT